MKGTFVEGLGRRVKLPGELGEIVEGTQGTENIVGNKEDTKKGI